MKNVTPVISSHQKCHEFVETNLVLLQVCDTSYKQWADFSWGKSTYAREATKQNHRKSRISEKERSKWISEAGY